MLRFSLALLATLALFVSSGPAAEKLKLLIVDGQNNHNWKATTPVLKAFLEKSGRFTVTVATSPARNGKEADWARFQPDFAANDVVLSNYNGQLWPKPVQASLEKYVTGGGGLVIVHAANNAFPGWGEWNKMIGLGWRGAGYGERVALDKAG